MDDFAFIFVIFLLGIVAGFLFTMNINADYSYKQGQLDYHKGIIKYDFVNEVVAKEKE